MQRFGVKKDLAKNGRAEKMLLVVLSLLSILLLIPARARAQGSSTAVAGYSTEKRFAMPLIVSYSSKLVTRDDEGYDSSVDLEIDPSFVINSELKVISTFSASQSLIGEKDFTVDDGVLGLAWSGRPLLTEGLKVTASSSAGLPLSYDSREVISRQTVISAGPRLSYDFAALGVSDLTVGYAVRGYRYFNRYAVNTLGKANTEWAFRQTFDVSFSPIEGLTIGGTLALHNTWASDGLLRLQILHDESLAYAVTDKLEIAAGHKLGWRNALAADGESGNASFFDGRESVAYLQATYNF